MLIKPDARQFQALARLSKSDDGEVFMKLLETELEKLTNNLLDSSGDTTPRVQGMARECKDILTLLQVSPELAEKTR